MGDKSGQENWQEEKGSMEAGSMGEKSGQEGMSSMRSGVSAAHLQQYLHGVDYPAEKQDMIDAARTNSAPDEIMSFLNRLPDKTYNSPTEVEEEFTKTE